MKTVYRIGLAALLLILVLCPVQAANILIPGGNTIGLSLQTDGVAVVDFSAELPKKAGLREGDLICAVDGQPVSTATQVTQAVEASGGRPVELTLKRGEEEKNVTLSPNQTSDGWRLGILVRDSISGIGTVTYYDPETGSFGALGHGVGGKSGLLPMRGGSVLPSVITSVVKGREGTPGALQGSVTGRTATGKIVKNTSCGIFGTMECPDAATVDVATADQVHTGGAVIRSNVRGDRVEEFEVKLAAIYPDDANDRNLLLQVTDPDLLELTGGIVQGMSGSPILQDGRLVGAVTHVLVDDPTRGYGIFIGNMLNAAA